MNNTEEKIRICSCRSRDREGEDLDTYRTAYIQHFCDTIENLIATSKPKNREPGQTS